MAFPPFMLRTCLGNAGENALDLTTSLPHLFIRKMCAVALNCASIVFVNYLVRRLGLGAGELRTAQADGSRYHYGVLLSSWQTANGWDGR